MDYTKKIDYSSLSTYMDCPRKFLFQYIFHLRSPYKSIHLVFGACWHYGLEIPYRHLMTDKLTVKEATEMSIKAFLILWNLEGEEAFPNEDLVFPKSPGNAFNMYHAYWKKYLTSADKYKKVLGVETPFTIHLENNLPDYIGRQDLLFELSDKTLEIVDHKTAKAIFPNTLTGFDMSFQTDGYLSAGHMYYNKLPKMTYSVALCQKTKIDFHRFTIFKRAAVLEQFLCDLKRNMKEILQQINFLQFELETYKDRTDHITCFPRNPGYACTLFMTNCPYLDLCKNRNNPLLYKEDTPKGYVVEEWDPELHEADIKRRIKELK